MKGRERRNPGQRPGERRTHGRAASAPACRGHAWLEVSKREARIGNLHWPIRRRLVGGTKGRQACAAGIGFSQSPGEPQTTRAARTTKKESKGPQALCVRATRAPQS